jgi:hypothetical protein
VRTRNPGAAHYHAALDSGFARHSAPKTRLVNADADDVYVLLKQQSEKLGFRAVPTSTALEVGNKASIQTRVTNGDTDPSDLQTTLSSEVLQRRLLKLYRDAKSAEDEQGANILFLTIGFLKWFESPDSSELCEAPLFLIPVSLIRDRAGSRFRLASRDDERDRLRQDVLEQFGWRFHRIWSTDWFNNRKREIRRLAEAIQRAEFESPPPSNGGKAIETSIAITRQKSVSEMRLN